jgi:diguanylate cyclase (GGDEF)-like protein
MDDILFIVADVMVPTTVSVTGRDTVATAAKTISRGGLAALPVVTEGHIQGIVTPLQLLTAPPYRPVADVMTRGVTGATADLPLLQAYALMVRQRIEVLPVVEDGNVVGQISASAILRAQGQQTDPLTGLPAATALRAWAVAALARGHEISILFIDLDNFGLVNKMLSHVAGDDMLSSVAQLLGGLVDANTDLLCRYGGDEFAIATTRNEPGARELLQRIQHVVVLPIALGKEALQVTASVGMAGGRRAEGRKRAHIAATVDDLIILASRASTAVKDAKRAAEPASRRGAAPKEEQPAGATSTAGRPQEARLRLVDVQVETDQRGGAATVTLALGTHEGVGRADGPVHGQGILFLVAEATLDAIRRTAGETHTYVVEELNEVPTAKDKLAVAVLARSTDEPREFVGSARAPDLPHAVTRAILDALNRPLARSLGQHQPGGGSG